jgi:hypothetical protein
MIENIRISFKYDKTWTTHTALNMESFWEFMGNKNASLIEIGKHVQYYEKLY